MPTQLPPEDNDPNSFICDCEENMRQACAGEGFYKEKEGKRYCVLHYPGDEKVADFQTALHKKQSAQDYNFSGVWFPKGLRFKDLHRVLNTDLSSASFNEGIDFSDVEFHVRAIFSDAHFNASVDFTGVVFSAGADFSGAQFDGGADFSSAKFSANAIFRFAGFSGKAKFYYSSFSADATFSFAKFSADTDFSVASFSRDADFSFASFSRDADFSAARFSGNADFLSSSFSADTNFGSAGFGGDAHFFNSSFSRDANFSAARFSGNASFSSSSFSGQAKFFFSIFSGLAGFSGATFSRDVDFVTAIFSADATFRSAIFSADADFRSASFGGNTDFALSSFSADANFGSANFSADAGFPSARFSATADFSSAKFCAVADFRLAIFKDYFYFAGKPKSRSYGNKQQLNFQFAHFEKPERVSFHTLDLKPLWFVNVDSRKFEFIDVEFKFDLNEELKSLNNADISARHRLLAIACRQLAVNAEESHRYREASRLRYSASEARRIERFYGFVFWQLDWWYWLASGYGESVLRAFIVFVVLIGLFTIGYKNSDFDPTSKTVIAIQMPAAANSSPNTPNPQPTNTPNPQPTNTPNPQPRRLGWREAALYSFNVSILQKPELKPTGLWGNALVSLETVLGPAQAALLALALRRKFMR